MLPWRYVTKKHPGVFEIVFHPLQITVILNMVHYNTINFSIRYWLFCKRLR